MSGYTYILECAGGSYYTGSTKNIEVRLQQHQSGKGAKYTRARLPVKLIYIEEFETTGDAMRREIEIKSWSRKQKEELIAESNKK